MLTIQQTVDIPADRRLYIELPKTVPSGRTVVTLNFETLPPQTTEDGLDYEGDCPVCTAKNYTPNAETIAAIEEGRAMRRGEIPSPTFHSLKELLADMQS
jgi:hypothetical protein